MINFKRFNLVSESPDVGVVEKLESIGYDIKAKGKKILAYTNRNRKEEIKKIADLLKDEGAKFLEPDNKRVISLSSVGVVELKDGRIVIVKPLGKDVTKAEKKATNELDGLIKKAVEENDGPIEVRIGKETFKDIVSAGSEQIKGDPKADIALIDIDGEEVAFISHKKEGGANAFQSYSGISMNSSIDIYNSKLVKDFVLGINEYLINLNNSNVAESGMSFLKEIPNDSEGRKIVGKAIYGFDWNQGSKKFNRNFVNCVGQGDPKLTKKGKVYELDFSEELRTHTDISWAFSGPYKACIGATYRLGRRIENSGVVIENLRGIICPIKMISNRRNTINL